MLEIYKDPLKKSCHIIWYFALKWWSYVFCIQHINFIWWSPSILFMLSCMRQKEGFPFSRPMNYIWTLGDLTLLSFFELLQKRSILPFKLSRKFDRGNKNLIFDKEKTYICIALAFLISIICRIFIFVCNQKWTFNPIILKELIKFKFTFRCYFCA